ncbi:T6SS phospholipase effector Tle1-like catalytic domain-containing protein [Massilia glaciei]|uniref:DUF2235 domain-containing protein n=2 Tax=Pseudomonadati TaxID=3379134 RepID=A0A2U2HP70_9BURK|nr:DUF2235 domain-containing protein [Massilia glaciei]PWF49293.1 DUF2235 domain-containing protein [Massilia glaciei]
MKNNCRSGVSSFSCVQTLWFSFFFDGTGNNLDADIGTLKHSNIAKLYRAHRGNEDNGGVEQKTDDQSSGIYRIYVPGIGTYFQAIKDSGGTVLGLGAGDLGTDRLDWASRHFDEKMARHIALARNPANAIVEINIAAFGFSRGAALARAFIHDFVKERCQEMTKGKWSMKNGGYPVRIRFMGLFDTVASSGLAMASNNMGMIDAIAGTIKSHISTRLQSYKNTRPEVLAFAARAVPGADPAPGLNDGHRRYGDRLQIPDMVEDVRHFIAAHEIRNSFPVDSISKIEKNGRYKKTSKFYEYIYPGVHSDVGGSYRPGEGGKNEKFQTKIGLIPLRDMYRFALGSGVPLNPSTCWSDDTKVDFAVDDKVVKDYQYYLSHVGTAKNMGSLLNLHMRLYYAWRFYSIRKKRNGDITEANRIRQASVGFKAESYKLQQEIKQLEAKEAHAGGKLAVANWNREDFLQEAGRAKNGVHLTELEKNVIAAGLEQRRAVDGVFKAKARLLSLPNTDNLPEIIDIYDKQLMLDAQRIYDLVFHPEFDSYRREFKPNRASLRPHYKVLIEAYENEFIKDQGLRDEVIIGFFDNYIHDSLAGFGKDSTLPSDPRVVYVGGDEKLAYAQLDPANQSETNRNIA